MAALLPDGRAKRETLQPRIAHTLRSWAPRNDGLFDQTERAFAFVARFVRPYIAI